MSGRLLAIDLQKSINCCTFAPALSNGIKAITSDFGSEDLGSIPG